MAQNYSLQLDKLEELITQDIKKMSKNANRYRKNYKRTFLASTALTGLITIISGIGYEGVIIFHIKSQHLILILGVVITFLSILLNFNSHNKLWISNAIALNKLQELNNKIKFELQNEMSDNDNIEEFKNTYFTIISDYNERWVETRKNNLKPTK